MGREQLQAFPHRSGEIVKDSPLALNDSAGSQVAKDSDSQQSTQSDSSVDKSPRMHFFRGTFKFFGQSMNACFAGLFITELLIIAACSQMVLGSPWAVPEFTGMMLFFMVCMGLYDARQRETVKGVGFRLVAAMAFAWATLTLGAWVLGIEGVSILGVLGASLLTLPLLGGVRLMFHKYLDGKVLKRRILVIGTGRRAKVIESLRRKADRRGYDLVGFVASNTCQHCYVSSDKIVTMDKKVRDYALANEIDEIVIALDDQRSGVPTEDLLDCRMSGIKVTKDLDFFEREASLIQLDVIKPSWLIYAKGFNSHDFRYWEKRVFDVIGASLLLVCLSPVMLVATIAIWMECGFRAPVIYSQRRVGLGGKVFTLHKFRSMCVDAEKNGQPQWAQKVDPRVTRVGEKLRKFRIDEIPQLWNVLKGEMSLVGPRPERPEFMEGLEAANPFFRERHRVAPGLTGWAQLCFPYGASEEDSIQKLKFDLYYIKNHGFFLDLYILAQTAEVVLFQRGSR